MSLLLPPIIIGPVSVASTSVRVDGPLPGSKIDLLVNGISKVQWIASSTTSNIALGGVGLVAGDQLTARWYAGTDVSDPTPVPEIVLPLPGKLGPLVFLSQVHNCVDWIVLGGAYPGALVELYNGATQIAAQIAESEVVSIQVGGTINTGNALKAVQSIQSPTGLLKSDPVPSLASEALPYQERSMPRPSIGKVTACAQAVPVSGLVQGATAHLITANGVLKYPFVGSDMWALLGREAHPPEAFTAEQHFQRCNISSLESAPPVPVDKSAPPRKPVIHASSIGCSAAGAITVSNLDSGAVVTFKLTGASSAVVIGRLGVGQGMNSVQFWLPDLSAIVPSAPPFPFLTVVQEACGLSTESDRVWFSFHPQVEPFAPYVYDPVECAHYVQVNCVSEVVARLYSDQVDSPVISAPTFLSNSKWIKTYRALRAGEKITVKLEATCQPPELRTSQPATVLALPALAAPEVVKPVRVFHTAVYLKGVIPGSQVHVFVNGSWRATASATGIYGVLPVVVGNLNVEDRITAIQAMCTRLSPPTNPPEVVQLGKMKVAPAPASLVQGQPATLTINALNVDDGAPVAATVSLGGNVVGTANAPFPVAPALGQASLKFSVAATGYTTEVLDVPAAAPPPVKPAVLTIMTALNFVASKKSISDIRWDLQGPANSFSKTEYPNAATSAIQFTLPKPPAGAFTPFTLSCLVNFKYEGLYLNPNESGSGSTDQIEGGFIKPSPKTIELHWTGVDMTANFSVEYAQPLDAFVARFTGTT